VFSYLTFIFFYIFTPFISSHYTVVQCSITALLSSQNQNVTNVDIFRLVGTTSLGFNLFLGGSMAKGKALESSQRGIAFSTISALEVSVLILIVGAGTFQADSSEPFSIKMLADLIRSLIGEVGVFIFAVGFIAAALSSMLAVPLGAALTADSLFSRCEE
jgi:Mn2+/Fe2+ NRAMP family transporter